MRKSSGGLLLHFMLSARAAAILSVPPCICRTLAVDQFPSLRLNLLPGSQRDVDLQLSLIAAEVKIPKLALKPGPSWTRAAAFFPLLQKVGLVNSKCVPELTAKALQIRELNITKSNSTKENNFVMQKGE